MTHQGTRLLLGNDKKILRRGINAEFKGNSVGKFSDVFQTVERIFRHFSDNLQEYSTVVNRTANIVNYLFSGRKMQKNGSPGGDRTHDQLLRRQLLYPLSYRAIFFCFLYNMHAFCENVK